MIFCMTKKIVFLFNAYQLNVQVKCAKSSRGDKRYITLFWRGGLIFFHEMCAVGNTGKT